jgi:hypothetical protein
MVELRKRKEPTTASAPPPLAKRNSGTGYVTCFFLLLSLCGFVVLDLAVGFGELRGGFFVGDSPKHWTGWMRGRRSLMWSLIVLRYVDFWRDGMGWDSVVERLWKNDAYKSFVLFDEGVWGRTLGRPSVGSAY